jgi:hypothetical protein
MGCSYRLRPTNGGETAGEGTIGGATEGGKDGGIIEGIIVVDEVGVQGRKEREFKRRMRYYEEGITGYAG